MTRGRTKRSRRLLVGVNSQRAAPACCPCSACSVWRPAQLPWRGTGRSLARFDSTGASPELCEAACLINCAGLSPPPLTPISSQLQLVTCQQTYGEHGLSAARTLRGGPRPRRRRRLPRPRRALLEPQCVQAPCASSLPCVNSNSTSMSRSAQAESAPATVSAGISPAITGGGGGHVARVKCRLTTLSTVYALREDGEPCTFVVGAHKRDCGDENDHEAAVDRLNLVHSCPEGVRPAYLAEDKAEIETKIAKMEERVREEARRTSAGPGGSTSGPTTRRRPGARSTPAGATRMPNTPDGGSRRLSSLATPGWGSASKPSGDLDERFPGAFHLRNHVSLLLQVRCSDMFSALRRGTD